MADALGVLPQLKSITLKDRGPKQLARLPHLRRLTIKLGDPEDAEGLARALPQLTCLTRLAFVDSFSDESEQPLQLPELQSLTALVEMQCIGWVPPQVRCCCICWCPVAAPGTAWRGCQPHSMHRHPALECSLQVWHCRHLSALTCWDCIEEGNAAALPAPAEMQLQCLQRLQLRGASFATDAGGCLRPQLCIPSLTSLLLVDAEYYEDKLLPPEFSRLRWEAGPQAGSVVGLGLARGACMHRTGLRAVPCLTCCSNLRQLAIEFLHLEEGAQPLTGLSSLTELNLPYSYGEPGWLPSGPYLRNVEVLGIPDIDCTANGPLLPEALSEATRLRVLHFNFGGRSFRLADWPRLQDELQHLRSLKVRASNCQRASLWLRSHTWVVRARRSFAAQKWTLAWSCS